MQDQAIQIITTADNHELAEHLAKAVIEERAAACVQIEKNIESFYRWKGKIEYQSEWRLTIKTLACKYLEVETILKREHAYETPEIIATPVVAANAAYLKWIQDSVL